MRVISRDKIHAFIKRRPQAHKSVTHWLDMILAKEWATPAQVREEIRTADIVANGLMIFNVGGNKYRIICRMGFNSKTMDILFVGTHKEYDKLDIAKL
ncbi:MAG: type II toxin-antitoxin system HigB family toxin [Candidatus Riflebacteria bacterium]|nr:type II toxin-antitoxin system HigB family toxin [Candidatus Riflebacteria bacterium]